MGDRSGDPGDSVSSRTGTGREISFRAEGIAVAGSFPGALVALSASKSIRQKQQPNPSGRSPICNFPPPRTSHLCPQANPARRNRSTLSKEITMKKMFSSFALACVMAASMATFAQSGQDQVKPDDTKQQDQMKNDQMKNDSMKKDDTTKKKSKKVKKDQMKKDDTMKHDDMKKDDTMKNDQMKQN